MNGWKNCELPIFGFAAEKVIPYSIVKVLFCFECLFGLQTTINSTLHNEINDDSVCTEFKSVKFELLRSLKIDFIYRSERGKLNENT